MICQVLEITVTTTEDDLGQNKKEHLFHFILQFFKITVKIFSITLTFLKQSCNFMTKKAVVLFFFP